jgi:predicted nucleic acid-binding Zn ribbon protein
MRRLEPRPLTQALDDLVSRLAPPTLAAAVARAWPEAAGEVIAAQSQPGAERAGVVTVHCRSAQWAQEIDLMSRLLVDRLNAQVGEGRVKRLRCVATPPRPGW